MSAPAHQVALGQVSAEEFDAWFTTFLGVFGMAAVPERLRRSAQVVELDRVIAGRDPGGAIVATSCAYSFRMTTPGGGEVPAAGVSLVSVRADHRRRGVLTRMMARLLDDAAARGEPVAALWASETPIYGRYGFGPAAPTVTITLQRAHGALTLDGPVADVRLLDPEAASRCLPDIHDRARRQRPGAMSYSPAWWTARILADDPALAGDQGPLRIAWLPERGYATFRVGVDWGPHGPQGRADVEELVALDPSASAALWRFVLDSDLTASTRAVRRPPDDVLLALLEDQGRAHVEASDALQVRLVDVPAALAARRYAADGRHVLEIRDPLRPANDGRWALSIDDGNAEVTATDAAPDLTMAVGDLASVWLGGTRTTQLLHAGRLGGGSPTAAAALDRAMATDLAPWHGGMF